MKYILTLAALPLALLPFYPGRPTQTQAQPVPTEVAGFEERWGEIIILERLEPFERTVRTITIRPEPVSDAAPAPVRARARVVRRVSLRRPDICQRHRMRKVWHGRSWNCRR